MLMEQFLRLILFRRARIHGDVVAVVKQSANHRAHFADKNDGKAFEGLLKCYFGK